MQNLNLSIIQSDLHWEEPTANRAMFEEIIWSKIQKTDVIILPEMFTTGFSREAKKLAEVPLTNTYKWMCQVAKEKSALVVGSYITKDGTDFFNRMYCVFPDGHEVHYDKRHLFTLAKEHHTFTAGTEKKIIDWKGWKICPLVCYDLRFPVWAKNKFEDGEYNYDLLIYSANWPSPRVNAWDTLLKARAIENQCYVAGANRIGVDGYEYEYSGHSGIYDYLGDTVAMQSSGETVISAELKKIELDEFRAKYPFVKDGDKFEIE